MVAPSTIGYSLPTGTFQIMPRPKLSEKGHWMRARLACLSALLVPLLGGCISTNTPGDLTFRSVELVDWKDRAELPGPGASPLIGLVSNRELVAHGESLTGGEKWHRPLLKIEFASATDLSQFVKDNSYNLGSTAFFCDHQETSPYMSFPYIYFRGIRLGLHEANPIAQVRGSADWPIVYYVFVEVARKARPQDIPPQEAFDQRKQPSDVCLYASGGNSVGRGYRSNTVVVPKDAIAAALEKALPDSGQ